MRPASADMLLRLLAEVVNLLLQGELLESVRRTFVVRQSWPYASHWVPPAHRHWGVYASQQGRGRPHHGQRTHCPGTSPARRSDTQWLRGHDPRHPPVVSPTPSKVALSVDIFIAFNTVRRSAVLQAVRTHLPSLSPWVDCCYRHESTLFTGSHHWCKECPAG